MNDGFNPYAPPASSEPSPREAPDDAEITRYYAASPLKVVLLSLATFGIYDIYWIYRQWKALRDRTGEQISPVGRAIFAIFFVNRLFPRIREDAQEAGVATTGATGLLVVVYILGEVIARVTARIESHGLWVVGFVSVVPLAILQREINQYLRRRDPEGDHAGGFGAGAIALLVLGLALWALVIVGQLAG